jgi:hypothetical protein
MLVDVALLETYNPMPDDSVELIPPLHVMQPPPPDDAGVVLLVMDNETPDAVVRLRYTVVPKYELPATPIPPPKVAQPVLADDEAVVLGKLMLVALISNMGVVLILNNHSELTVSDPMKFCTVLTCTTSPQFICPYIKALVDTDNPLGDTTLA